MPQRSPARGSFVFWYNGLVTPKSKDDKLKKIHQKWLKACKCKLKAGATQGVPGYGSAVAQVVFIGEAPGKAEDKMGRPFIGAAGKFLDQMLSSIKLSRESVYITNIVKYRPPNNRDPLPQEIKDCSEWLEEELDAIEPKLIVFLGRHALKHFFPKEKIGEVHGEILKNMIINKNKKQTKKEERKEERTYLALYHPAAALYNGGMRKILLADFRKIALLLKKSKV